MPASETPTQQAHKLCILGSTGSIGTSTLDVVRLHPEKYQVEVLTANNNFETMLQQCLEFEPEFAVMRDPQAALQLAKQLESHASNTLVKSGETALQQAANLVDVDITVAAIVGAAGLLPTLTAVEKGIKVLLANKEALVMAGELFIQAVKSSGALLMPVDSEHNAIFQCLPVSEVKARPQLQSVSKILLTGSGGPFRTLPLDELDSVTPEQACTHPNWDMGKKISVDSATMMNKGLELIEACFLFSVDQQKVDIVIHPQSIIHSMVSYPDGSVLAQMGNPDMRTPIAHSLAWPERIESGVKPLDFQTMTSLTFETPDYERFPCLKLASDALSRGGTAPCILNAANEVAVEAFLLQEIAFTDIPVIIEKVMRQQPASEVTDLEQVLAADKQARLLARDFIKAAEDSV